MTPNKLRTEVRQSLSLIGMAALTVLASIGLGVTAGADRHVNNGPPPPEESDHLAHHDRVVFRVPHLHPIWPARSPSPIDASTVSAAMAIKDRL